MTVDELIKSLQTYPKDSEVRISVVSPDSYDNIDTWSIEVPIAITSFYCGMTVIYPE